MITIVAKSILKKGTKQSFVAAVQHLIRCSRNEPGNIKYDLYEDITDDNTVCFIEEWEDQAAIDRHNNSEHFKAWIAAKGEFVDQGEVIKYKMM